ncbi:thiamine phosphate synthase [Formosa sp. S-31]|uniref:thiamine phosphate synthase n=1 Tax=Formosa sp. S-31 TaxID=2790949 RepID=UPI003EB7112E
MISKLHYITQGNSPEAHLNHLENACRFGADWIQLRMKQFETIVVLETAKKAREITRLYGARLIINDFYEIAKAVEADGVHLGQTDACPKKVRSVLGTDFIIGGTANSLEHCKTLLEKNIDYIGLGPYRYTTTKTKLEPLLGISGYSTILQKLNTDVPVIGIGGITTKGLSALLNTGLHGVAVSGEITKDFSAITAFQSKLYKELSPAFNTKKN